jgi:hypothetical protein
MSTPLFRDVTDTMIFGMGGRRAYSRFHLSVFSCIAVASILTTTMTNHQRCPANFDNGTNFSLCEKTCKQAGGWFLCTMVEQGKCENVKQQFDVGETKTVARFELLARPTYVWKSPNASLAATERPYKLYVGDLVLGHFQHGSTDGAWYRGRMAATRGSVCDIAYDDGVLERNIPLTEVVLFQSGFAHPEWLLGLSVPIPSKKKKVASGVVIVAQGGQSLLLQYVDAQKNQSTQKKSYTAVVKAVFRQYMPTKTLEWST